MTIVVSCLDSKRLQIPEVEPDQRHVDMLVKELDLQEAKPVCTPGEAEVRGDEEDNARFLNESESTRYRAMAARANYLSADRTDMMYATKEIC